MRNLALFAVLALASAGCGSVCDGAVAAEKSANQKAVNCSVTNIDVHDANKCNSGLSKCNSDDLSELNSYANCLNGLPVCSSSNQIQFTSQRQGCLNQALFKVSPGCFSSIL